MKPLLLLILLSFSPLTIEAAQSVTVTSGCNFASLAFCPTVTIPSGAPWTTIGLGNNRWETRVSASGTIDWQIGPFHIFTIGSTFGITNAVPPPTTDTLGPPPEVPITITGYTDVLVRLQRDNARQVWELTMCNTAPGQTGGGPPTCQVNTYPIITPGQASIVGQTIAFSAGGAVAFLREFSTVVPPFTTIQVAGVTGDLLDWEFEGSLTDSVRGLTFTGNPSLSVAYSTTPVYNPYCSNGIQQSFKTGVVGALDGSSSQALDGGTTLNAVWSYAGTGADGVTQSSLSFGTPNSLTTTISGYIKGSVNLTLTLTDGSSNTSNCTIHDGAVHVQSNDTVITGLPTGQDHILGPLLKWESPSNIAPWYDDRNLTLVNLQGNAINTNGPIYWTTFKSGTVAISNTATCMGSPAGQGLIGTGTDFVMDFSPGQYIVIAWNGGANHYLNIVDSTPSTTCAVLHYPMNFPMSETGLHFGQPDTNVVNIWGVAQASSPYNYYDNVEAYRSFYERTGIDTFWTFYTTLADRFWAVPPMDQGLAFERVGGGFLGPLLLVVPRNQSLQGMMIRAMDPGMSAMWTGIGVVITADNILLNSSNTNGWGAPNPSDTRDVGYAMTFAALYSEFGPDATLAANCRTLLAMVIDNLIANGVQGNGSIPTLELTFVDLTNTMTVTNGSRTVTCSGCNFTGIFQQNTVTTLASNIDNSTTVCPVNSNPGGLPGNYFFIGSEGFKIISNVGNTINCQRGQYGTTPVSHNSGDAVTMTSQPYLAMWDGFPTAPVDNTFFRPTVYRPIVVNSTTLTLDQPYVEASGTVGYAYDGDSSAVSNPYMIGWNLQPFLGAILTVGLVETSTALQVSNPAESTNALIYANGMAGWLQTYGYADPAFGGVGGMYYYQSGLLCSYPTQTVFCTLGFDAGASRSDSAEALHALTWYYLKSPTVGLKTFITTLYSQMYCKPGFPGTCTTDGSYLTSLNDGQSSMSSLPQSSKWLGFFFGYSAGINSAAVLAPNFTVPNENVTRVGGVFYAGGVHQ